MTWIRKCQKYY